MDYHLNISIQEGSVADRNIQNVSKTQHLSQEEAALSLIGSPSPNEETPAALIARVRASKARRNSGIWPVATPDGNADKLIGFLADSPEVAEAIRDLARERRNQTYGS